MESTAGKPPLALLLVDDDAELCGMMKELFGEAGFTLDCAFNGRDGLARALKNSYDLIVLDVMLPMIDGFTVLQQLRRRTEVPVIMLTARVHRRDRIEGLNAGADDYLPKPFDPDELVARNPGGAAARRAAGAQSRFNQNVWRGTGEYANPRGVERRAFGGSDVAGVRSAGDADPRGGTCGDAGRNDGGSAGARVVAI